MNEFTDEVVAKVAKRFISSATGKPPTYGQKEDSKALSAKVIYLAQWIEAYIPEGRDKALALTALEDVLMRSNRAIYAEQ